MQNFQFHFRHIGFMLGWLTVFYNCFKGLNLDNSKVATVLTITRVALSRFKCPKNYLV